MVVGAIKNTNPGLAKGLHQGPVVEPIDDLGVAETAHIHSRRNGAVCDHQVNPMHSLLAQ